ncbi:nascent polypeptide-associated complex subunit alpha, muscle-specific form-like isoform X2 [Amphibalanus amphitrite]|uniref:nascent polypeptide-associated complex subunit alpha, muscle-specific form-like isoform X2 n=1 Tax=Amphibalanus amphitrite TaxID=1232801 RepID=UPI001C908729|nr:nascent polypeptide-associated complex subunit alpha, muscle-specific form-like isoform X2 [Amphibalanus amphitrite]
MPAVFSAVVGVSLSRRSSLLGLCDVMEVAEGREQRPPLRPPRKRRPQAPATARPPPQVAPPVLRLLGPAQGAPQSPSQLPHGSARLGGEGSAPRPPPTDCEAADRTARAPPAEPSRLKPPVPTASKPTLAAVRRSASSRPPVPPPPVPPRSPPTEGHTRVFRTKSAPGGHQARLSVFPTAAGTPVEVTVLQSVPSAGGSAPSAGGPASSAGQTSDGPSNPERRAAAGWPTQTVTWGFTAWSLSPGAYNQYLRPVNGHGGTYHKDSYMAHRRDWRQGLGHEGRYRRTESPSPAGERRRPSWPVALSPPTIARSVSYAAPSRQGPQPAPLRLPHPASAERLHPAPSDTDESQSWASDSQSTAGPPSPSGSLSAPTAGPQSPSGSLGTLPPPSPGGSRTLPLPTAGSRTLSPPTPETRPRHHSAGSIGSGRQLSAISIEVVPPAESGGQSEPAVAADEEVFAAAVPPTALPEEDAAESDAGDAPEEAGPTPAAGDGPPAGQPPAPSPPPARSAPPRPGGRRGSVDLLSVSPASPGVSRRPSLPASAGPATARPPAPPAVNGVHRASRVAAGLAWSERQTARDLLDPRHLPEATAAQQETWRRGGSGAAKGTAGDVSPADLPWLVRPDVTSLPLTVTSHQVGTGRRIPLIVTTPVDPTIDTALSSGSESSVSDPDNAEAIRQRQSELSASLARQLAALREEQRAVEEEAAANAALGAAVAARVEQLARPSEAERYRAAVDQVSTITSLLLGLAGRLARTEAALDALPPHCPEEKALLTSKRDKLSDQLSEARQLEEGVRRRRQLIDTCLERYLSSDELADHRHFVQTKAKLIQDAREIEDKIRRKEEQLAALSRAALST